MVLDVHVIASVDVAQSEAPTATNREPLDATALYAPEGIVREVQVIPSGELAATVPAIEPATAAKTEPPQATPV